MFSLPATSAGDGGTTPTSARAKEKARVKERMIKEKEKEIMGKEITAEEKEGKERMEEKDGVERMEEKDGEEKTEEKDGTEEHQETSKERVKEREEVRKAKGCMSFRAGMNGTGGVQSIRGKEEIGKEEIGMGQIHLFRAIHGCVDCAR